MTNYSTIISSTSEIELSQQFRAHFVDLILQKWPERRQFFTMFFKIEFSLQARAHVDLIFQKWWDAVFFVVFCETELSPQSRAHFVDLIVQKWPEAVSLFTIFLEAGALATVSCAFSPSSCETAETETLQRGTTTVTFPEKNTGSRECFLQA